MVYFVFLVYLFFLVFMIFVYIIIDKYINFNIISFKISININNNSIYYVYYINIPYYFKLYKAVLLAFIVLKKPKKPKQSILLIIG